MSGPKTKPTEVKALDFLNAIEDERKREDSLEVLELMQEITGAKGVMWGPSIVGFGSYHFKYESGREGDWMEVGFSPRKANLTLYIMSGFGRYDGLMEKLGKFKTGKSCLYIKRLDDVDRDVLRQLVTESVAHIRKTHAKD